MAVVGVTGADSAIGQAVVDECNRLGLTVVLITRRPGDGDRRFLELGTPIAPNLLEGLDALIHLAWDWTTDPVVSRERNLFSSLRLVDLCVEKAVRPVLLSTFSAFSSDVSQYGAMKLRIESRVAAAGGVSARAGVIWGGKGNETGILGTIKRLSLLPLCVHIAPDPDLYLSDVESLAKVLVDLAVSSSVPTAGVVLAVAKQPIRLSEMQHAYGPRPRRVHFKVPVAFLLAVAKVAEKLKLPLPFRSDSLNAIGPSPLFGPGVGLPGNDDFRGPKDFTVWLTQRRR